jgi:hypothetical protein
MLGCGLQAGLNAVLRAVSLTTSSPVRITGRDMTLTQSTSYRMRVANTGLRNTNPASPIISSSRASN